MQSQRSEFKIPPRPKSMVSNLTFYRPCYNIPPIYPVNETQSEFHIHVYILFQLRTYQFKYFVHQKNLKSKIWNHIQPDF